MKNIFFSIDNTLDIDDGKIMLMLPNLSNNNITI